MYHSITIGDKNTWGDWHLIPATRPLFNPPSVKTNMVDIPGGDGSLDLTTVLAGRPTYNNRTGSFTFYVANGYQDWAELYSDIMTYLQGQKFKAILEDDPDYYYEGRFWVNNWKSDKDWSTITMNYEVGPFKKSIVAEGDDWLWDTFNFETDMIQSFENLPVNGSLSITIEGDEISFPPTIITSAPNMTVTFGDVTYSLNRGVNYIVDLVLHAGDNTLIFSGVGTVTIKYERGRL